jgi:hypothetical protein
MGLTFLPAAVGTNQYLAAVLISDCTGIGRHGVKYPDTRSAKLDIGQFPVGAKMQTSLIIK